MAERIRKIGVGLREFPSRRDPIEQVHRLPLPYSLSGQRPLSTHDLPLSADLGSLKRPQ